MNDRNPALDYGPSDFSVKHRFVNSAVYSLPVGRGKHYLGGMNRAEDLADWRVAIERDRDLPDRVPIFNQRP